jgi:tripeptide aminopeptidase
VTKGIVDLFCEMARVDSESGNEQRFISYMAELLRQELGGSTMLDAHGNLICKVPARDSEASSSILFVAHADTVSPGVGIEPVVRNGAILSSGDTILGADDKAGIAEVVEAVRTAPRRPPVEIALTLSEETTQAGARNLDLSLIDSKWAFVVDADDLNEIVVGGPTYIALDIGIRGRAAHAGLQPEAGLSAIRVAAEGVLNAMEGRIDEETTANLGIIRGGEIRNGVPEHVSIQGECRSLVHEKALLHVGVMRQAFEAAAARSGAELVFSDRIELRAARFASESAIVQRAVEAVSSVGLVPAVKVIIGATDALILANRGLEAVALGMGAKEAHTTREQISISDLETGARILRHLLCHTA